MASNLRAILELMQETTLSLGEDYANWLNFLRTASRNYKYSFADQLLIYAQKPEAVACAELKFWNRQFGRLVNRNSKGIALIDDSSDRLRLHYVFDVSDTHSPSGEEIELWQMQEDYAWDVKAALEQRFGRLQGARNLSQVLRAVAKRAAEQNVAEYAAELAPYAGNGEQWEFEQTVAASVEYMLLNRCDLDTAEFASDWAMPFLHKYNKISSATVLGCAVSDISEVILREIERKVVVLSKPFGKTSQWHRVAVATAAPVEVLPVVLPDEKQMPTENRTFANEEQLVDNVSENKTQTERSEDYGHKLQTDGGLPAAGVDTAGATATWEVWQDEERVPEELPQSVLHNPVGERQAVEPFAGGGEQGEGAGAAANRADGKEGRLERGSESKRPDEVGRRDEQYPTGGAGAGDERGNLQLNLPQTQGGDEELPPFVMPEMSEPTAQLSLFDMPSYGERYTAWFADSGIKYSRDGIGKPYDTVNLSWDKVAKRIAGLIAQGRYIQEEQPKVEPEPPHKVVNGVSIPVDGDWTEFPGVAEAEEAAYGEYRRQVKANAQNFRITDDELGTGGAKEKFQANVNAIKLLQYLEQEGIEATAEQQEVLARYVGWGGLPEAFDESNTAWQKEYAELKELLSDDEYSSARASTLNAHYTQPQIIRVMYKALENMGFRGGNILEPALGVGNFFGMLSNTMQNSKLYGVELDSVSGRIAKKLYPKANIEVGGFEDSNLPDNFFDVAVGNVPFGNYFLSDSRYNKHHFLIHDYFFAKALDKVRPGGVIAFITSKGTMDK